MIIGFLIKYIGGDSRVPIAHPNCTITNATEKLYIKVVNDKQYSYSLSGPVLKNKSSDQSSELAQKVSDVGSKSLACLLKFDVPCQAYLCPCFAQLLNFWCKHHAGIVLMVPRVGFGIYCGSIFQNGLRILKPV